MPRAPFKYRVSSCTTSVILFSIEFNLESDNIYNTKNLFNHTYFTNQSLITLYGNSLFWYFAACSIHMHTRMHTFKGPLPGTIRVSWYQKSKNQSGFYWNKRQWVAVASFGPYVCKSAPRSRQITMPAPHHSGFYRPDTLPATQPTASKHICSIYIHKHTKHNANKKQWL